MAEERHKWHYDQEGLAEEGEHGKDRDKVRLKMEKVDVIMGEYGQEEIRERGYESGDEGMEEDWLYGACTSLDGG